MWHSVWVTQVAQMFCLVEENCYGRHNRKHSGMILDRNAIDERMIELAAPLREKQAAGAQSPGQMS